jgi:hypothetical protein
MGIDLLKRKLGTRKSKLETRNLNRNNVGITRLMQQMGRLGKLECLTLLGSSVVVARPEETGTGVHSNNEYLQYLQSPPEEYCTDPAKIVSHCANSPD